MGGGVPRAIKQKSVHVKSHIWNRPNKIPLCFFTNFRPHELSLTGPPAIELALDISSGSGYCFLYYTYYLSIAPLPPKTQPGAGWACLLNLRDGRCSASSCCQQEKTRG